MFAPQMLPYGPTDLPRVRRCDTIEGFHVKGKLRSLSPMVRTTDTSTTKLPPKALDPVYNTPEFKMWRAAVKQRAGYRCEAIDQYGHRCSKTAPEHRLYADHIRELRDGGSLTDHANGMLLCASHHEVKTVAARMRRHLASW